MGRRLATPDANVFSSHFLSKSEFERMRLATSGGYCSRRIQLSLAKFSTISTAKSLTSTAASASVLKSCLSPSLSVDCPLIVLSSLSRLSSVRSPDCRLYRPVSTAPSFSAMSSPGPCPSTWSGIVPTYRLLVPSRAVPMRYRPNLIPREGQSDSQ